uniref:Uncharacterized protein n=1 Tax=Setaria viridis TaxID=4556 RepID=A0A4U6V3Y5_SETVI|nr:hypothetical protein SEVIR_4G125600v2 [Setaria viridis]
MLPCRMKPLYKKLLFRSFKSPSMQAELLGL